MPVLRRRSRVWTTTFAIAVAVYFGLIIEMNVHVYYVNMYLQPKSFKLVMICYHMVES